MTIQPDAPRACPICADREWRLHLICLVGGREVRLHRCLHCRVVVSDLVFSKALRLGSLYKDPPPPNSGWPAYRRGLNNRGRRVLRRVGMVPGLDRRVLEIGPGRGYLLEPFVQAGWKATAIELSKANAHYLKAHHKEVSVVTASLDKARLADRSMDVIVLSHVLEHMIDPIDALRRLRRALRSGGVLYIALPNIDSIEARRRRADWSGLVLPHHLYHFGPVSLRTLLNRAGFRVIDLTTSTQIVTAGTFSTVLGGAGAAALRSWVNRHLRGAKELIRSLAGRLDLGEEIEVFARVAP